jgi:hypothetical protein
MCIGFVRRCRQLNFCIIVFLTVECLAQETPSGRDYVDRALFPKAYSILTSDRLMFPQNMIDWPLKIDTRRQLFVDEYLIAERKNVHREYHKPVKHPKNPLIVSDRPWESSRLCVGTVLRDESANKFRMWYRDGKRRVMYAESKDGITWNKPDLGLIKYKGSKKNNIIIKDGYMIGMVRNLQASNPQERYTAIVAHNWKVVKKPGYYLYHSPDGLRWTGEMDRPVLTSSSNPKLFSSVGIGDTSIFRYDPILQRYVVDVKFNLYLPAQLMKDQEIAVGAIKNRVKSRAMIESDDLVHWTPPRFTFFPDEHDERDTQIYGHISFPYESMWLGMLRVMHMERTGWKQVEIELSYSRDGRHWSRPNFRRPFLPLGDEASWEPDYSDPAINGPILVGDELWIYYRGTRSKFRDNTADYKMACGLAKLRRDGFVSLNAGQTPGQLITRPLTFEGRSLYINADVAEGGWVKAAVLTSDSKSITGYTLDKAIPLTKDTTKGGIVWKSEKKLMPPGDEHVRLLFQLKDAKLYSFWIE